MSNVEVLPHLIYNRGACYLRFLKDSLGPFWILLTSQGEKSFLLFQNMGQTDGEMDGWKDRQADGRAEKQTDGRPNYLLSTPLIAWNINEVLKQLKWFCYFCVFSRTCLPVPLRNHLSHLLIRWNSYRMKNRSWRSCTEEINKFHCCIREETQKKIASWGK